MNDAQDSLDKAYIKSRTHICRKDDLICSGRDEMIIQQSYRDKNMQIGGTVMYYVNYCPLCGLKATKGDE